MFILSSKLLKAKNIKATPLLSLTLLLTGCAALWQAYEPGFYLNSRKGVYYYYPENCYSTIDVENNASLIECLDIDKKPTGVILKPADPATVQAYFAQRGNQLQAIQGAANHLQGVNQQLTPKPLFPYKPYGY